MESNKILIKSNLIFQDSSWHSVLEKTYNLKIEKIDYKTCCNKSDLIISDIPFVIKKRGNLSKYIALPFSDYCGFSGEDFSNELLEYLKSKHNENLFIEIREKVESENFVKDLVGYKHFLDLSPDLEEIFQSFKKTQVQQPIQKSIRDGLISEVKNDYSSLIKFYELHLITRRKLGVPIQPKKFFYHLWEEILNKELGYVVLVTYDKKVISAGVFCGIGNTITYKFSASHPAYLHYRPNNLMLWTGIQEAKRRGFEIFDFGRTDLDTEGLRKFKLGWGTVEEPLYYSYYPKPSNSQMFKFIKNKIVAPIIRNSPSFVCRMSGELLYKYFG